MDIYMRHNLQGYCFQIYNFVVPVEITFLFDAEMYIMDPMTDNTFYTGIINFGVKGLKILSKGLVNLTNTLMKKN